MKHFLRKPPGRLPTKPIAHAPISGYAADVAVSEMTGIPLEHLCGFVVVASRHGAGDECTTVIVPSGADLAGALLLVRKAEADLRIFAKGRA